MKKALQPEDSTIPPYSFMDNTEEAPIAFRENGPLMAVKRLPDSTLLDGFVTAVKWVFLYVPGAASVHLIMVGLALLLFYDTWSVEMFAGTLGVAIVSIFMIMLGIGKLTDLRYLRVVAGIFAAGALASIVYGILAVLIPGDFFGFYTRLTLPVSLLMGYLVKRHTDRTLEND